MTVLATEPSTVLVGDDELVVEHLRITDPETVAFVASGDDHELALVRCVEMGARVLRLANVTVDTQVVEHRFDQMTQTLDRSVDDLARRIDNSARALLDDETGELTAALRGWLSDVTATLGATFDENSKQSAIAKLEKLLESARAEQVARYADCSTPTATTARSTAGAPRSWGRSATAARRSSGSSTT